MRVLSALVVIVFCLFAASISSGACVPPPLLLTNGSTWAPNANVGVVTGGVPSAVTPAVANWNFGLIASGRACYQPFRS